MSPVLLGIAGCGLAANEHARSLSLLSGSFKVVAVANRTIDKAIALSKKFPGSIAVTGGVSELLEFPEIEALDICLPIGLLFTAVETSLLANKHILSEKPISASLRLGQKLIKLSQERQSSVWMVGEQIRYWPALNKAFELLSAGEVGLPILLYLPINQTIKDTPYFKTAWRNEVNSEGGFEGGFLLDGGVHYAAIARLLLGNIEEVSAFTHHTDFEIPKPDTFGAIFKFKNGALGFMGGTFALKNTGLSRLAKYAAKFSGGYDSVINRIAPPIHLMGTDGSIFIDDDNVKLVRGTKYFIFKTKPFEDATYNQFIEFAEAIKDGKSFINTAHESLIDLSIVEAIFESAKSKSVAYPDKLLMKN